jgi:hypothetical protein
MFVFFVFRKVVLLNVVHPLNIHQGTTFHGPALSNAKSIHLNKFKPPPFWNGCSYQKLMGGGGQTDRMVISLAYVFSLWRKVDYKNSFNDICDPPECSPRPTFGSRPIGWEPLVYVLQGRTVLLTGVKHGGDSTGPKATTVATAMKTPQ